MNEPLTRWAWRTPPGARRTYHTGSIMRERQQWVGGRQWMEDVEQPLTKDAKRIDALAKEAWGLYERGLITLTQRKVGEREWDYVATRVGKTWGVR